MKVESWQGINGKLVHDEQKAIVVDNDGSGAKFTQGECILYHELKLEVFR